MSNSQRNKVITIKDWQEYWLLRCKEMGWCYVRISAKLVSEKEENVFSLLSVQRVLDTEMYGKVEREM